ncbi:MAG: hypothetical protein E7279_11450 [Lachnospiraceae bacterium]|nr:hypothetical protein [Lachnospiraceae bacterium]
MKKRIIAIGLIAILLVSTLAGCSCSNSTTNNTTTTGYKCDFKNSDIAIPEGTKLTDNGLEVTDKADATVKNVLDIEKQLPVLIARDGDGEISPELKYMQETNAKKLRWNNYNAVADYTAETANQIDPTFGKVTEFGKDVFNVARAYYTGDVGAAISGVSGFLNMFGIFGSGGGVSNEQILLEVQKVYSAVQEVALDVKDVQSLLSVMTSQLDEVTLQSYRNGLQPFDNAMIAVDTDAEILQQMFVTGATILQQQGINAPAENATDAERQEYIGKLVSTMKEQQNSTPDLNSFDSIMSDLVSNYVLVAGELGKTKDFSPLSAFDSYWDTYFNWESQGYALKVAYRANSEFQIKRAYALIALYYNIGKDNTAVTYQKYGQLLSDALNSIEQSSPGISPQQVAGAHKVNPSPGDTDGETWWPLTCPCIELNLDNGLYSSTFDKRLDSIWMFSPDDNNDDAKEMSKKMPTELMAKYAEKLHGKTLGEDLKLAGLYDNLPKTGFDENGLVSNFKVKDKTEGFCNLIDSNGNFTEDYRIQSKEWASFVWKNEKKGTWYTYQYMLHFQ